MHNGQTFKNGNDLVTVAPSGTSVRFTVRQAGTVASVVLALDQAAELHGVLEALVMSLAPAPEAPAAPVHPV